MELVRIVVVGDPGVGKTSLVLNLVQDFQSKGVPSKARAVNLPVSHNTRTSVIDTSSKSGDKKEVDKEIKDAHFICILYDINVPKTRDNVVAHWIPRIKAIRQGLLTSLAVVGTKYDLCEDEELKQKQLDEFQEFCDDLIDKYEEIEFILESSAKENRESIEGIFERAREAVLYPVTPLIDFNGNITQSFWHAIRRIFDIIDNNGKSLTPDGLLDKDDLKTLREFSFDKKDSDDILNATLKRIEEGEATFVMEKYSGLTREGLVTFEGLVILFRLMVEDEVICAWTILRKYGYDRTLSIRDDYCLPKWKEHKDQKLALSENAFEILHNIFEKHCDSNKLLDREALVKIFEPIPASLDFGISPTNNSNYASFHGEWTQITQPWASLTFPYCCNAAYDENDNYKINEDIFRAMWMLGMQIDKKVVLKQFAYLGYSPATVQLTKFVATSSCLLMHVAIFGKSGTGKSSLIMAQNPVSSKSTATNDTVESMGTFLEDHKKKMVEAYGTDKRHYGIAFHSLHQFSQDKWLVLEELPEKEQSEYFEDEKAEFPFDLAIFMCDQSNPDSCTYAMNLLSEFMKLDNDKPALIVQSKSDLLKSMALIDKKQTESIISTYRVPTLSLSTTGEDLSQIFLTIIETAISYQHHRGDAEFTIAMQITSAAIGVVLLFLFGNWVKRGGVTSLVSAGKYVLDLGKFGKHKY